MTNEFSKERALEMLDNAVAYLHEHYLDSPVQDYAINTLQLNRQLNG